jgi:hypothetical protein
MTLHKITEFYTEWFSVCPSITSKFRTIIIPKNLVKQNDSRIICTHVCGLSLYYTLFALSATVHELSP